MLTTALSLVFTLIALLPGPHLKESLKALLALLIKGRGKARPQHTPLKSPSALSRFLNHYPWPTRLFIRTTRKAMERALLAQIAHRRRGPRPRLLVFIDLVTRPKRGCFPALPLSFFHGQWGLHLVVLYLVYGPLRLPGLAREGRKDPLPSRPSPPQNLCLSFGHHLLNYGFQPFIDAMNQNGAPVLGAPDHVILAGVHNVSVGFESASHKNIILSAEV